jgi:hypothetical protein
MGGLLPGAVSCAHHCFARYTNTRVTPHRCDLVTLNLEEYYSSLAHSALHRPACAVSMTRIRMPDGRPAVVIGC